MGVIFHGGCVHKFIWKWVLASLITPIFIIVTSSFVFDTVLQMITLFFWPSSIFLMSLGAEDRSISDIVYVWSIAVSVNMVLYAIIGAVIYLIFYRKTESK
jgi:hypothetical protein